ncbi:hypothetical protein ACIQRS_05230 [Streptomyces termitum]|uniref:Uncharacterized protein n=1 Tax=Streptomyces termitum TaxID=67368 RepID=A0A918SYZ4_9ACTN|nr:hypothetical protein [Streptomyces termitum]GHA77290.1 hypothetical protein GCM10010305_20220 [Streptomyces termitum]
MGRQDLADALDGALLERPLPADAVRVLGAWPAGAGARYAAGTGGHSVEYVPARWADVTAWPDRFGDRSGTETARVSRDQVVAAVREAVEHGRWAEALTASYVWGQGRTGYGPHRLRAILAGSGTSESLASAGRTLQEDGAVAAYGALRGAVKGLGPAFFTKFLFFLDLAVHPSAAPRALILDQRVARVLRAHATRTGQEAGLPSAAGTAAWTWSDSNWTPHRYEIYLRWITAASNQLAASAPDWADAGPDVLELALFEGVWNPAAPA